MKLGLFTAALTKLSLDELIPCVTALGIEAIELGTGNYGKPAHIQVELIEQPEKLKDLRKKLQDAGLFISALGCGGNVLHPDTRIAEAMRQPCGERFCWPKPWKFRQSSTSQVVRVTLIMRSIPTS